MTPRHRQSALAAVLLATIAALAPGSLGHAAAGQTGGVVLDGWGGLHPFGGFTLNVAGGPYWQGWDIARAVAVRDDGSGGWVLDGWGGIHAFGSAPSIATPVYTAGADTARDLVVTSKDASGLPTGAAGYVLTGDGALHPWGGAPPLSGSVWAGQDVARGLLVHYNGATPDGAWVLLRDGSIEHVGSAPPIALNDERVPPVWQHLHANADGTLWALADWGVTTGAGPTASPSIPETASWSGYSDWGAWNILRDIHLAALPAGTTPTSAAQPVSAGALNAYRTTYRPPGGVSLDGWGGLHPFGGWPLNTAGAGYWYGWDIARSLLLREDGGGGWTLDGFGGIHPFGGAPAAASDASYWSGWDIARDVVITSHDAHGNLDGREGYTLDAWGGVHPFGGAPALASPGYWPGWDIARGLDVHLNSSGTPDGVLILDAWGGMHYAGNYPAVSQPPYYAGHEAYERLQRTSDGTLFAVTHFGWASGLGPENVSTVPWHTSGMTPYWAGYSDTGVWDMVRDVAVGRSDNPSPAGQPVSWAAANAYADRVTTLWARYLNAPSLRQDMPLDCESASTAAALNMVGSGASQEWVFSDLPDDTRPAVMSGGVPVEWGDAWTSFVGNVFGSEQAFTGYGVYYAPIQHVLADAGHSGWGGQNWTLNDMMAEVDRGHPVIIWVSSAWQFTPTSTWMGFDGATVPYTTYDHTVLLYGIDPGAQTISLMDVWTGTYRTFSWGQFASFMATWANMAVAVQ